MSVFRNRSHIRTPVSGHDYQKIRLGRRVTGVVALICGAQFLTACVVTPNALPEPPIAPGARFSVAQTGAPVELVGILAIVDKDGCKLDDGCGPKYRIFSEDFDDRIPLLGNISDDHGDQIIRVVGTWTFLSDEDSKGVDREWGDTAVDVTRYEVLSPLKYRAFLVEKANDYTQQNFGCSSLWDKSFRWRINDDQLSLIVRMTQNEVDLATLPYVELRYDAATQLLADENRSGEDVNPCQSAAAE